MRNLKLALLLILLLPPSLAQATVQHFVTPLEHAKWIVSKSRLVCRMKQTIPAYGQAIFSQFNGQFGSNFLLSSWQGVDPGRSADIFSKRPPWKNNAQGHYINSVKMRPGHYPILLNHTLTKRLLAELQRGNIARFTYDSSIGFKVIIDVSNVNYQGAYAQYIRCVGNLLPFTFADVEKTRVFFTHGQWELSENDKDQLNKVRDYVRADRSVKTVNIAGYADSSGPRAFNNYLSQLRAEAVKRYLTQKGVPKRKIRITWYGAPKVPIKIETALPNELAEERKVIVQLRK